MDLDTYRLETEKLARVLRAGMVLTAAGLASDVHWRADEMRNTTRVRIDIPYNSRWKPVHAFGGGVSGSFWELARLLLAQSSIRAPEVLCKDQECLANGAESLYIEGPGESVSAHEVISATEILTDALKELGLSGVDMAKFLELRA